MSIPVPAQSKPRLQPLIYWECGFKSCRGAWKSVNCECCVVR